jgi:hypothetical protein
MNVYLAIVLDDAKHFPTREIATGVVGFLWQLENKTARTTKIFHSFLVDEMQVIFSVL